MKQPAKIQCLHPQGKHAPAIAADTYNLFEKAIYHVLKQKKQLGFTEMMKEVEKCFKQQKTKFSGSISWFGVTVKNHMEAKGIIRSFMEKGRKQHVLV